MHILRVITFVGLLSAALSAGPAEHLNFGQHINASQCSPTGKLVINVVQHVTGDADSGVAGNAWAFDDFNRTIQVWQNAPNKFCAVVKYHGSFSTLAGPSPDGKATVGAGVDGTFEGGYQSTVFTGTLKANPAYSTRGNIGDFNYQCDINFNCPGAVDWTTIYFDATSDFGLAWWGWVYHAGDNGSWVNAITGNSGDITGN